MSESTPSTAPTPAGDPGTTTPPTPTSPGATPVTTPTVAPAPGVDPAIEQRATEAEQAAQRATAERDEVLAALRKVLDPSGAAGEQDPTQLATRATAARDAALAEAKQLRVELAAHQAAHKAGADPTRLLDSRTVEKQLAELEPGDAKFGEQLAAVIAAAVEANPLLRADGPGPTKGGADFTGTQPPERRPTSLHDAIAARLGG
ncbi:hypothetical protein ACIBCO_36165 [Streptomyces violascens]|uniref:hypothetical protein n=1 Tax=Streptomyces violascens TaxID=67381 RepID=UPI00378959A6